jgi:hypothetical protein
MTGAIAAPAAAAATTPTSYTCDLTSYGASLAPLTIGATVTATSSVTAGDPVTVTLQTETTSIPSATAANLPAIAYLALSGAATMSGAGTTAALTGKTENLGMPAGGLRQLPSITATGTVTPDSAGSFSVTAPATIRLVPSDAAGQMTPVTCTASSAVKVAVTVLAAASGPPQTAAPTGLTQPYECSSGDQLAMRLGHSGPDQVAATDQVSLSSAEPMGSMADDTPMSAVAELGLSGQTRGDVPLAPGMPDGKLALTAAWQPQSSGLFRLTAPHSFQVRLRKTTSATVTVECVATTTTTVTTTVRVTASSMSSTAAQGIAAAESGSTAAPDTGGGGSLHSPIDMTLLAVGLVVVLGGIGLIVIAIRRRTGGTLTP